MSVSPERSVQFSESEKRRWKEKGGEKSGNWMKKHGRAEDMK